MLLKYCSENYTIYSDQSAGKLFPGIQTAETFPEKPQRRNAAGVIHAAADQIFRCVPVKNAVYQTD